MSNPMIYATVPSPVSIAYETYLEWCRESKLKIINEDAGAHKLEFKDGFYSFRYLLAFTPCEDCNKSNLALEYIGNSGTVDYSGALRTSLVEPFLAKINGKVLAEAQSKLAGISPEQIMHVEQPVPADVEALLQKARNDSSSFGRREAIRALGALPESNERIVAVLILARESDPHEDAMSDAANALKSPAHQAILNKDPEWAAQITALGKVGQVNKLKEEQVSRSNERFGKNLIWQGGVFIFVGALSIIYNLLGYTLFVWGIGRMNTPICGGLLIVVGVAMIILSNLPSNK